MSTIPTYNASLANAPMNSYQSVEYRKSRFWSDTGLDYGQGMSEHGSPVMVKPKTDRSQWLGKLDRRIHNTSDQKMVDDVCGGSEFPEPGAKEYEEMEKGTLLAQGWRKKDSNTQSMIDSLVQQDQSHCELVKDAQSHENEIHDDYKSRAQLAKEARHWAGEDSGSDSRSADEAVPDEWSQEWSQEWSPAPRRAASIFTKYESDIDELQDENKELKGRLAKLEKTVSVLELIRKQSEKDRLEEMLKHGFKDITHSVVSADEGSNVTMNVYDGNTKKTEPDRKSVV